MYVDQLEEKLLQKDERRWKIINKALRAVNDIILDDAKNDSEINYLTMVVATRLLEKAMQPFRSAVIEKDLSDDH